MGHDTAKELRLDVGLGLDHQAAVVGVEKELAGLGVGNELNEVVLATAGAYQDTIVRMCECRHKRGRGATVTAVVAVACARAPEALQIVTVGDAEPLPQVTEYLWAVVLELERVVQDVAFLGQELVLVHMHEVAHHQVLPLAILPELHNMPPTARHPAPAHCHVARHGGDARCC